VKEILVRGKYSGTILVDDKDYPRVKKHKWYAGFNGDFRYARAYIKVPGKNEGRRWRTKKVLKVVMMHRLILGLSDAEFVVQHIDGDGWNNQRSNLRVTPLHTVQGRLYRNLAQPYWWVSVRVRGEYQDIGYAEDFEEANRIMERAIHDARLQLMTKV